ncbi:MAG: ABC transporter permease subunit [Pseudomonadota bacterium]
MVGIALFLLAWQLIGEWRLLGLTWPPLDAVLATLLDPARRGLFQRALAATVGAASLGYAVGLALGLSLALVIHLLPLIKSGADRLAAVVNAIPGIALGPILIVTVSQEATPATLAAIHVFFLIYVAASAGLAAASRAHRDLFGVLGADRWTRLRRLEAPAALPALASGMKLAITAAVLGAILGEWFGAPRGLGIVIVNAMQNFQIPLLWAAVLLATLVSLALFGIAAALERAAYGRFR